MATPKEQHDARPNARNIGRVHSRALPADATPPGGMRALTLHELTAADVPGAPSSAARAGEETATREAAEHA